MYTIYFSPLQGYTDYVYRKTYSSHFPYIKKFFIPYTTSENDGSIRNNRKRDVLPENNKNVNVIPQILIGDKEEALRLCSFLAENNFQEINLNFGCPFPMVVNKGKGCALILQPEKINDILEAIFKNFNFRVSIKTRTGLNNHEELLPIIPILNSYPLEEVIIHARYGKQQYKGNADPKVFLNYKNQLKANVVYNGDIDFDSFNNILKNEMPDQRHIMIGRGILQNPFLPAIINNVKIDNEKEIITSFLNNLLGAYSNENEHEDQVLNKLQSHWEYLHEFFPNGSKSAKKIKKARNISEYKDAVNEIIVSKY